MREVVVPDVYANGFWNHFTGKKKWRIKCGKCSHGWSEKVPIQEPCSAICPCCGAQNKWSAIAFQKAYEASLDN